MKLDDILDQRRQSVPGCDAVAYGDYAARLILRASHETRMQREILDELCDRAADGFALLDAISTPQSTDVANRRQTALFSADNCMVFVRSDPAASEFLCICCQHGTKLDTLFQAATDTLEQLR